MSRLNYILTNSRWIWFLKGLPSLPRARTLFQIRRYTLTNPTRCRTLWDQCKKVLDANVVGSFVECGVWRGGSSATMGLAIRHSGQTRDLHLFDSFEGLPEPTEKDGSLAKEYCGGRASGELRSVSHCKIGLQEVQDFLLGRLRLDASKVHFHEGWFQNTVPMIAPKLGPIALLRLDGDWYESTRICLEHLYPLLSPGGIVVLDDYFDWIGCKKATDEYRVKNNIVAPMTGALPNAASWTKP
ncbi:MAG: TylF/MycF/NovP-related O-methyltransferase [Limisphaerales bacterium]